MSRCRSHLQYVLTHTIYHHLGGSPHSAYSKAEFPASLAGSLITPPDQHLSWWLVSGRECAFPGSSELLTYCFVMSS